MCNQPENGLFLSYLERVELFFDANDIVDEKKVAVFFSVVGSKTYSLLRWRVQSEIHFGVHARIPKNEPPSIN